MGIQKRFQCYSIFLMVLLFAVPSYAAVFSVTETMPAANVVEFSVTTDYTDVIGFAVGSDYAFDYSAATEGWGSYVAYNIAGTWKLGVWENPTGGSSDTGLPNFPGLTYQGFDEYPEIGFDLNDVNEGSFDNYFRAFVFYAVDVNPSAINTAGFYGMAAMPDSSYAAFRRDDDTGEISILTGETSAVPVPGAAALLFSGLAGLVGMIRRQS